MKCLTCGGLIAEDGTDCSYNDHCPDCVVELLNAVPTLLEAMAGQQVKIERLDRITTAQRELLSWYETEHDRSQQDDDDLPEDFRELEQALRVAEGGEEN